MYKKVMGYARTAYNRSVYASGAVAPSGYEKPQSACGLCAFFLRHIFAVAGNLRFPLSQPQKRHIQPERYAQLFFELVDKISTTLYNKKKNNFIIKIVLIKTYEKMLKSYWNNIV
jgi:hypothetical protein